MSAPPFVDAQRLEAALPIEQAVAALAAGFGAVLPEAPERTNLPVEAGELLTMTAHGAQGAGVKLVTICRDNPARGLPLIDGVFALFAPDTLALEALLDGAALTALRTAAVSALATSLLADERAERMVLFGAGRQAHAHLRAMAAVRPLRWVGIVDPDAARAAGLVEAAAGLGLNAERVGAEAVAHAQLICTCTTSATPLFDGETVAPGAHVNAMGAYRPSDRELDGALIARARVVVETRAAALAEAGDLLLPIERGEVEGDPIAADLSELVRGAPVRRSPADVTVLKSVGVAFEDLIVARAAYARLRGEDPPI